MFCEGWTERKNGTVLVLPYQQIIAQYNGGSKEIKLHPGIHLPEGSTERKGDQKGQFLCFCILYA
jgi:hypothetical protein